MTCAIWIRRSAKFLWKTYVAISTVIITLLLLNGIISLVVFYL